MINKRIFSLSLLPVAFFMWGALTALNDVLIPHLKSLLSLNYTQAMLVQFVFFATYALISIPMGKLVFRIHHKWGIVIGFFITGIACLGFIPAAASSLYVFFLGSLVFLGAGITLLQVAANPYAALLGEPKTASSRLTIMQALNSLGTTIAPIFGGLLILSVVIGQATHAQVVASIQKPYLILALIMFLMGIVFTFSPLKRVDDNSHETIKKDIDKKTGYMATLKHKHLLLGCLGIFLYVGAEVSIGSFLINYFQQPYIGGITAQKAANYVALYWGGAMVGRFIGSYILKQISPAKMVAFNAACAIILVLTTMMTTHQVAMWSIILVGLFNSILFPTIFGLAHRELHLNSTYGSALLCTAIVGGAIVPIIQGFFADKIGIHFSFFIPVLCYLYIFYYGIKGYDSKVVLH
jgi:FHS family L-fucose permease-like MFS transporter